MCDFSAETFSAETTHRKFAKGRKDCVKK